MQSRLVMMFYSDNDTNLNDMYDSLDTFYSINASEIDRFKIVIHLTKPSDRLKNTIRDRYPNAILVTSKSKLCAPCVLKQRRVRYGVVIPPGYKSAWPLWPYLDELRQTLRTHAVSHIKLCPDTDLQNHKTHEPIVRHYVTENVMIGNGNFCNDIPVLLKDKTNKDTDGPVGVLKPIVFTKN